MESLVGLNLEQLGIAAVAITIMAMSAKQAFGIYDGRIADLKEQQARVEKLLARILKIKEDDNE